MGGWSEEMSAEVTSDAGRRFLVAFVSWPPSSNKEHPDEKMLTGHILLCLNVHKDRPKVETSV